MTIRKGEPCPTPELESRSIEPMGKFPHSLSFLSWAYNEEENIQGFLERAVALMESLTDDYEIILIDDYSSDRTYELAKKFQETNARLRIIRNYKNLDCGINTRLAIRNAVKEYTIWQTADEAFDLTHIRRFLEFLGQYDIVQGVRRTRKTSGYFARIPWLKGVELDERSDNLVKGFISVSNYLLVRFLFGVNLSDFQNVSIFPREFIQSVELESASAFSNPECIIKCYWKGARIKEVPIHFTPRKKGVAKGTRPKAIFEALRDIFYFWFKWRVLGLRQHKSAGKICQFDASEWKDILSE